MTPLPRGAGGGTLHTPICDKDQSEVKWSRQNFEAGRAVKLGIRGSSKSLQLINWRG